MQYAIIVVRAVRAVTVGLSHATQLALWLMLTVFGPGVATADWVQFQGDAGHTGFVETNLKPATLAPAWSVAAPPYSAGPGERGVAIVDGDVYATMLQGYGFSGPYLVNRFDGATGNRKWQVAIPANSHSGVSAPTVVGNTVYVHHWGHSGSSGSTTPEDFPALVGLNKDTGSQLFWTTHSGQWSSGSRPTVQGDAVFAAGGYYGGLDVYNLNGDYHLFLDVNQQYGWIPAADDDNAYVYMGAASASPGPSVGSLYVFDRATGVRTTVLHPRSDFTHYALQSVMLGGRADAFAITLTDHPARPNSVTIVAFDIASQSIKWEVDGAFSGNPAVGNGIIAAPNSNTLAILDQDTGAELWSWNGNAVSGNVVLTDHYAFVRSGGSVHAIDLLSHYSVWNSAGIVGDIALDGNLLVISNPTGVYAFAGVPEPSSSVLFALGATGIGRMIRRRRRPTPTQPATQVRRLQS